MISCKDTTVGLAGVNLAGLRGWKDSELDDFSKIIEFCIADVQNDAGMTDALSIMRYNLAHLPAIRQQIAKDVESKSRSEQWRAAASAKAAAVRQCEASPAYLVASASWEIHTDSNNILALRQMIEHEKEVGRVSGYVDASKLHDYAAQMLAYDSLRQTAWKQYTANHGPAASMDAVETLANP